MHEMHDVPDLELLTFFDALYGERHLTRAAQRAGRSQPAMSRALGRLRALFGDPLFVRSPRGMLPTPRADALAPEVRRVLADAKALVRPRALRPTEITRTFVVATSDLVEAHMLSRITALVAREAPGVDVVTKPVPSDLLPELETGRVDLLIALPGTLPEGVMVQQLFEDTFLCAVRRDHPEVRRTLTLERYLRLRHVQIAPRGMPGGPVDAALAARGLSRRVAVRTPSFLSAPLLVSRSDFVLTAPRLVLEPLAKPFGLRTFPLPIEVPGFRVASAWHPRAQGDPAHRWFRELVARSVRGERERRA